MKQEEKEFDNGLFVLQSWLQTEMQTRNLAVTSNYKVQIYP